MIDQVAQEPGMEIDDELSEMEVRRIRRILMIGALSAGTPWPSVGDRVPVSYTHLTLPTKA